METSAKSVFLSVPLAFCYSKLLGFGSVEKAKRKSKALHASQTLGRDATDELPGDRVG